MATITLHTGERERLDAAIEQAFGPLDAIEEDVLAEMRAIALDMLNDAIQAEHWRASIDHRRFSRAQALLDACEAIAAC